jgi:hypothetical protein
VRGEDRDQDERDEPDDVEVEPVVDGELQRDQHGGAQSGELADVGAPRDEGDREREPYGGGLHE